MGGGGGVGDRHRRQQWDVAAGWCSLDGKAALVNGELSPWGTTNERTSSCECSKMYIYLLDPAGI